MTIYWSSRPTGILSTYAIVIGFAKPYYLISLSLNVLLTLMIITRLVVLSGRVRKTMNAPVRIGGLYKAIIASLVESCGLYTFAYILFLVPWYIDDPVSEVFTFVLTQIQVRDAHTFPRLKILTFSRHRPLLRSSLPCESPTGGPWRASLLSPERLVRFASGTRGSPRTAMGIRMEVLSSLKLLELGPRLTTMAIKGALGSCYCAWDSL
jgi:hypothetical protein